MIFKILDEIEYENFAANHPQASFLQSLASGKRRAIDGWKMHLVGVANDDKIVAAAMLSSRKSLLGYYDFECQHGPLVDYDDAETVQFLISEIIAYVRANRGLNIRINPNIPLNHNGNKYIDLLVKSGLYYMDNKAVDNDPNLLRWYFKKDMSDIHNDQELFANVDTKARQDMQRSEKMGVRIEVVGSDNLGDFLKLMESTGARRNFDWRDSKYYTSLLENFGPEHAMCAVAKLDMPVYRTYLDERLKQENMQLESARAEQDNAKFAARIKMHETQISELQKKISEAKTLGTEPIVMAGAIFIAYGKELVYLSSGAYTEYGKFCATYALQLFAMRYAIQHDIPIYNFYGTKGSFSGHPDMDGVYNFKKGFNGYLEEQIGYFYINVRPVLQWLKLALRRVRNLLR